MNWVDIVIAVVLILGAYFGFKRGLISTVFLAAGIVVGIILALQWGGAATEWLEGVPYAQVISFAVILIGVMIVAHIVGGMLKRILRLVMLGWLDKLAGAAVGVVIGGLLIGGLVMQIGVVEKTPIVGGLKQVGTVTEAIEKAKLDNVVMKQIGRIGPFLPAQYATWFDKVYGVSDPFTGVKRLLELANDGDYEDAGAYLDPATQEFLKNYPGGAKAVLDARTKNKTLVKVEKVSVTSVAGKENVVYKLSYKDGSQLQRTDTVVKDKEGRWKVSSTIVQ